MFKTSLQASFPCRFLLQCSVRGAHCGLPCRHTEALHQQRHFSKIVQTSSPQTWVPQRSVRSCRSHAMASLRAGPTKGSQPGNSTASGKQQGDQDGELGQQNWASCFSLPPLPEWPVHCAANRVSMAISLWAMESCSRFLVLPEHLMGSQRSWRLASVGIILHLFFFPTMLPDCQRRLPGRCSADEYAGLTHQVVFARALQYWHSQGKKDECSAKWERSQNGVS